MESVDNGIAGHVQVVNLGLEQSKPGGEVGVMECCHQVLDNQRHDGQNKEP